MSYHRDDESEKDIYSVYDQGYAILKQVFKPEDIRQIALCFHRHYLDKYRSGLVSHRNYKRFPCKIPAHIDYAAILCNDYIHQMMCALLGSDYVLSTLSSHSAMSGSSEQMIHIDGDTCLFSGDYRFD